MTAALHYTPIENAALLEADYRSAIEAAVVERLAWFDQEKGGYLKTVGFFDREMSSTSYEDAFERMLGNAPAMLVHTGDARFGTATTARSVIEVRLEVFVWFFNNNERSHAARVRGDDASVISEANDPGMYQMLLDARQALLLHEIADFAGPLEPVSEEPVGRGEEDGLIYVQRYAVRVFESKSTWPPSAGAVKGEDLEAKNQVPRSESDYPEETNVTTLTDPLETE